MALSHVEFYAELDAAGGANPLLNVPSVSWGAGDRVYVIVSGKDDDATVNTITAAGLTFTQVRVQDEVTQQQVYAELWESGLAAGSGTQTVAIQMTSVAHIGGLMASVLVVSGSSPTTDAHNGAETGATDTTTPGVDVTTVAATTRLFYAFQTRNQTVTLDGADGLTSIRATDFAGTAGNIAGMTLAYKDVASQGTYNGSGTITATDWVAIGWSVKEIAAAGGSYRPVRIANRNVGPMVLRRRFRQPVMRWPDTISTSVFPATATVTVAANDPDPAVAPNAGTAAVTVAANTAAGIPGQSAFAGSAAVTVAAQGPASSVKPNAGTAAVVVAASSPKPSIVVVASTVAVTVAAGNAVGSDETPIGLEITHADTTADFIDFIKVGTLQIKTNADRRNGTMDVTLVGTPADFDAGPSGLWPAVENFIRFPYGADVLFAGVIRSVKPRDTTPGHIEYALGCQDYTYLPFDDVVDPSVASGVRTTVESDFARIDWLLTTFTQNWDDVAGAVSADPAKVDTLLAVLPAQDFTGMTIAAALDEICKLSGGTWFIDFDADLNYGKRGISFIQRVASRGSSSSTSTLVATLSSITTTVGHHLILKATGGAVIASVADSKGNTWQVDVTNAGGSDRPSIASCKITTALVSSDTITVTWASATFGAFVVDEFTGLDPTTWFDKSASAVGTGTAADSGATAATTDAHTTLLVAAVGHASTVGSFAMETLVPPWVLGASAASTSTVKTIENAHRMVFGEPATFSAKATWTTSRGWGAAIAAYREAVNEAPFGLSDAPDNVTTYGYADLVIPQESTELKNRVVILGASGYMTTLVDTVSRSLYNDVGRTGVIKDNEIVDDEGAAAAAAAFFAENAYHQVQGTLRTFRSGLTPGLDVDITSANQLFGQFGGTVGTQTFRVGSLTTTYPRRQEISYQVGFGTIPRQMPDTIRRLVRGVTPEEAAAIADDAVRHNGASSFPNGPAIDDRFYRSDLGMWFFWNGTRWLSVDLHTLAMFMDIDLPIAFGPDSRSTQRGSLQAHAGGSDIWLEELHTSFFVKTGGSALSGSHKWVGDLSMAPSNTPLATVTIASGSSGVWRAGAVQTVDQLIGTDFEAELAWSKTGTPGDLYALAELTYRIVAT